MTERETIVVKLGGSLLDTLPDSFYSECVTLQKSGVRLVVVHGGGPRIDDYAQQLALQPQFVNGLRVTDAAMLELVEMVLGGSLNKRLVTRLERVGGAAIGISGIDRGLLQVKQQEPELGFVGAIEHVNIDVVEDVCSLGWIPVIASLGVDDADGQHYNINADTAASAIAAALHADQLVMVTDVPGIMTKDEGKTVARLTPAHVERLLLDGTIQGGMIPKVNAALASVEKGVKSVCIVDGQAPGVLTSLMTAGKASVPGTKIVAEGSEADGVDGDVYALVNRSG